MQQRPKSSLQAQMIEVGPEHAGQRIDNFLKTALKGVPTTHIYRILRKGEVRVNKGRIKPHYRLESGDVVRVPPLRLAPARSVPENNDRLFAILQDRILFEDKDLLVLNKPAGLAVHGGSGVSYGAIEALRVMYPQLKRLELVHRLDRDTSGCLVFAKKASILTALHDAIRDNQIEKKYIALLKGVVPEGELVIDTPLQKNVERSGERMVVVSDDGKPSVTVMRRIEAYRDASLVDITLLTGRTHQIRVHSQSIGHPVAGDEKYGDNEFNKLMKKVGLNRLFLHASELEFIHPGTGEEMRFRAPLDESLRAVLNKLER